MYFGTKSRPKDKPFSRLYLEKEWVGHFYTSISAFCWKGRCICICSCFESCLLPKPPLSCNTSLYQLYCDEETLRKCFLLDVFSDSMISACICYFAHWETFHALMHIHRKMFFSDKRFYIILFTFSCSFKLSSSSLLYIYMGWI